MFNTQAIQQRLENCQQFIHPHHTSVAGRLVRVVGLTLEAVGVKADIGSQCVVETSKGQLIAEVIGFSGEHTYLMPEQGLQGVAPGARVLPVSAKAKLPLSMKLLGRVIDGVGKPLDVLGPIKTDDENYHAEPLNPLARRAISEPLDVGVRSINSFITVGKGQRMGLFAGSGIGKSVLMGMMTRGTNADVIVVGLVGERGREVKEFIEEILGEEGRKRSVVVAAPADNSPR